MAEQRQLLHNREAGDDEQYGFSSSDEEWDEKNIADLPRDNHFGARNLLLVTLVAAICMLSLGYIVVDWAHYMTSNAGEAHDHAAPVMNMDMGANEPVATIPAASIPIPVPTLAYTSTVAQATSTPEATKEPEPSKAAEQDKYILSKDFDTSAPPTRREYHWHVAEKMLNPDGVFRPMILINEEYPGPLIECNEGDTIVVNVHNEGTNATAIHYHGLYQNGTNWMDGTVGVTQCPIAPGANFTYEFKVDGQSGTYWYHGHQGVQSADGLYGPLVIHSKDERQLQQLEYDTDRVVMLTDHYWDLSSELLLDYLASDAENAEPVPNSALINGRGMRDCSQVGGRHCDNSTSNVGPLPFDLEPGKNHRLRIINTGAFAEFQVSIDQHEFAITEVDGTDVVPANFHRLVIQPAQRYSMIVSNNQAPGQSFWLRAKMISTCFAEPNPYLQTEVWAPVRWLNVGGGPNTEIPMSPDFYEVITLICKDLDTSELHPVVPVIAPQPTVSMFFRVNFEIGGWQLSRGKFNQSSWHGDVQHPTLSKAIEGYNQETTSLPGSINDYTFNSEKELVLQTEGIQVVDILLHNFDDGNHPLHLHGYKFFVLAQGHGYPPKNLTETVDLSNPLRRDTASVEAYGWTLIRLIADNPGAWSFHCHISWHAEAGLMMSFLTRADEVAKMVVPEANRALCAAPLEELQKGMSPEDEYFFGTLEERELKTSPRRFFSAGLLA